MHTAYVAPSYQEARHKHLDPITLGPTPHRLDKTELSLHGATLHGSGQEGELAQQYWFIEVSASFDVRQRE
jgi:hypothetical protein